jgi:hypothetical protein
MLFPIIALPVLLILGWYLDEFSAGDVFSWIICAVGVVIFCAYVNLPPYVVTVGFAVVDIVLILKIFGRDIPAGRW